MQNFLYFIFFFFGFVTGVVTVMVLSLYFYQKARIDQDKVRKRFYKEEVKNLN